MTNAEIASQKCRVGLLTHRYGIIGGLHFVKPTLRPNGIVIMTNAEIARVFNEIADLLEMKGENQLRDLGG